jgi:excisionase family DNA binding protein
MSPWTADNNTNNKETTSKVKEEVPRMNTTTPSPQRLEQALEAFVGDLEGLEGSLLKFEEALLELEEGTLEEGTLEEGALKEGALKEGALKEGAPEHQNGHNGHNNLRLLSPSEVCQELGEERTVVYRRLRSGEIPCLKLGHALKVRQADLQEYMKGQQQQLHSLGEENSFRER